MSRRDFWLIGGGKMNSLLTENQWVDEMRIFLMPVVLGGGIPLFSQKLKLGMHGHLRLSPISMSLFMSGSILVGMSIGVQPEYTAIGEKRTHGVESCWGVEEIEAAHSRFIELGAKGV